MKPIGIYKAQLKHLALALTIGAGLAAGNAHGQTPSTVEESFDYATGNLSGKNGGTGFTDAWSNTRNNPTVSEPGKLWGALHAPGNYSRGAAWSGVIRPIGTTLLDANLLDDGATLWFSVILDLEGQNTSNADINVALCNATKFESGSFGNRENLIPSTAEGIGVTHSKAVINGVYWENDNSRTELPSSLNIGAGRALIVGKIDWGATALDNETITLYAPGLDLTLGTPILAASAVDPLDQATFNQIAIQYKDHSQVDEIRFGATSAEVLPVSTTVPTLASADIVDDQGGGPIGDDIAVITYTLTFNVPMDIGTITDADFDNAGTATATIGTVTQPDQTQVQVQVLPTTTGTVQLRIPATSVLSGYNALDLDTTSAILDDTTITINAGATPDTGNRYFDGGSVNLTGPTDGVSQGGAGTWDTTTLNWDPGAGFADYVAWNNANNDIAILGGTGGAITLAEPITVGGVQIQDVDIDIKSSTLTFGVAGEINSTGSGNQNNPPIISSVIAGAGVTKTGNAYIRLDADNTMASFTLNAGWVGQLPNTTAGDPYLGFGTGLLTINGGGFFTTNNDPTYIPNDMVWNANWRIQNVSNGNKITTFAGDVTMGANVTISSKHTIYLDGVISDGGNNYQLSLQDDGGGANYHLNGANTFGGGVNWKEDNLTINNAAGLGTGTFIIQNAASTMDNKSGGPITLSTNNVQEWRGSFTFAGTNDLNLGTGAVTMFANHTITVNAGTLTVGGAIGGGALSITLNGPGTLALAGANTYSGATAVNAGTLALTAGSQSSPITVGASGSLDFTLGSTVTSSSSVNLTNGVVTITGAVDNSSDYQLMTATGGFTFTDPLTQLGTMIPDYELQLQNSDTELWLVYTGGAGSKFDTWAATGTMGPVTFDGDTNGDSVADGLAFLLGATNPDDNALGLLPTPTEDGSGGLVMTFTMLDSASRGTAALSVEHSGDLGITDAWVAALVPDTTSTVSGVDFVVSGSGTLSVVATIPETGNAIGGELFGRLVGTE